MTTLSGDQILYYRRLSGVNTSHLTNTMIQEAYDRSSLLDDDASIVKALTVVDMLQQLWGLHLMVIDVRGEVESESRNVIFDRIKIQLDYWSGQAGVNGAGVISPGSLTLNLNYTDEDIGNTWP